MGYERNPDIHLEASWPTMHFRSTDHGRTYHEDDGRPESMTRALGIRCERHSRGEEVLLLGGSAVLDSDGHKEIITTMENTAPSDTNYRPFHLSGRRVSAIRRRQHFYTSRQLFEQSIDVYRPEYDCKEDVMVLLTVGSGWMGHQPWVYRGTSWWNSSGPKTIASALNCPCVCIRHRGAYVQLPDWFALLGYCLLSVGIVSGIFWYNDQQSMALLVPLILLSVCVFLKWTARGSANIDDMVDDVATAISWVQENEDQILPNPQNGHASSLPECQMVFGGYSSGGHVSATLLQRPADYWKQRGLPPPNKLFSAVMYISGVLATQPIYGDDDDDDNIQVTTRTVFSSRSNSSSGGSSGGSFSSDDGAERQKEAPFKQSVFMKEPDVQQNRPPPTWLTNCVCRIVWGPNWREELPSPLDGLFREDAAVPKIPHLLLENQNEMFGLTWLDVFFCAESYSKRLRRLQVPTVFRQVASDHWNVLASRELYMAVQEELPRILQRKK